jgi:regulator of sirC expression with transglutaminase-like and TPR domain
MARADRRRSRRTSAPAAAHRGGDTTLIEHELFFTKLRRQAKWLFVLLAIIFGGSFVVFGVGSEVPGGIADVLGGPRGDGGIPSVSDAREEVEERPNDPEALRQLATALQAEGQNREAIQTLERLTAIAPRDDSALRELATLYLARATTLRQRAQEVQARAQLLVPDESFMPPADTELGRALNERPISDAVRMEAQQEFTQIIQQLQEAYTRTKETYAAVAELTPNDPTIQLQLADAALNAGDSETAIAAYEQFLELAPNDPSAELVRQEVERLREGPGADTG